MVFVGAMIGWHYSPLRATIQTEITCSHWWGRIMKTSNAMIDWMAHVFLCQLGLPNSPSMTIDSDYLRGGNP